jgi:TPR repeat protein
MSANQTLIHCPACNREISILAESCPGCGIPFGSKQRSRHGVFYYVFFGTISLIATFFLLGFFGLFGTVFLGSFMSARESAREVAQQQASRTNDAASRLAEAQRRRQLEKEEEARATQKAADDFARIRQDAYDLARIQKDEEFKAATIKFLKEKAAEGGPMSQYRLAEKYLKGDGVPADLDQAKFWLQCSCTNGYAEASNLLHKIQSGGITAKQ